jgi:hypothetical protein
MDRKFFHHAFPFLFILVFTAGCGTSSPAAKSATDEPTQISVDEPPETAVEESPVVEITPTGESGQPVVFSSVTFEGALTLVDSRFEEGQELCNPFPPGATGCIETYNPCPEEGGGGGGGGGGDVACLKMADYCYTCKPDYGATMFFSILDPGKMYISPSTKRFTIDVDPEGYIIRFDWGLSFGGFNLEQTDLTSDPGTFHTRWDLFNANLTGKSPGYITVDGTGISFKLTGIPISDDYTEYQVTDLKGSGTWEIGHPIFGATGGGTWAFDSPYFTFTVNP